MVVSARPVVAAPKPHAPVYGLIAAAPPADLEALGGGGADRWEALGFEFLPEQCGRSGRIDITCLGSFGAAVPAAGETYEQYDPPDLGVTDNPAKVQGDAFAVWTVIRCDSFGWEAADYEGRARRQLDATQSFELANELWTGGLRDAAGLVNRALVDLDSDRVTDVGSAVEVHIGLSLIESALGQCGRGRQGMVHCTPGVLDALVNLAEIRLVGDKWVTPNGNLVVADAGYDGSGPGGVPGGTTQYMYGTSMVYVALGAVEMVPKEMRNALSRSDNTVTYVAERPVAYQCDWCCHFAAEVTFPVPLIGGAS